MICDYCPQSIRMRVERDRTRAAAPAESDAFKNTRPRDWAIAPSVVVAQRDVRYDHAEEVGGASPAAGSRPRFLLFGLPNGRYREILLLKNYAGTTS